MAELGVLSVLVNLYEEARKLEKEYFQKREEFFEEKSPCSMDEDRRRFDMINRFGNDLAPEISADECTTKYDNDQLKIETA